VKKYITTPIYYINAKPHLGHAYASIATDVLARFYRAQGDEVFFLTGTDEHGAKIAQVAEKAGEMPVVFADKISTLFSNLSQVLHLSNDEFIRTTDPRHEKIVQEFLQDLYDKGLVYEKQYEGLYCVACEEFKTEKELTDGCCPVHKTKAVKQNEKNWFFKLSQFKDQVKSIIESDEIRICPIERKNEILGKLKQGLDDISISRASVEWGIKVPWDDTQTIYVWFDALLNYFSAPKIYSREFAWPPDLHIVGRDIMWFHATIWPAMLLAHGEKLPKEIFVHGYFTVDGEKMSKTIGNVIDPVELTGKFGADAVRYHVLRDFPFGEDGDVSLDRLKERYNNDLGAGLGNLVQRVLSMVKRYQLPGIQYKASDGDKKQHQRIDELTAGFQFQQALIEIWKLIAQVNREIAEMTPWKLAKEGKTEDLKIYLEKCFGQVLQIRDLVAPYLPETAEKITAQAETLQPEPIFRKVD